MPYREAEINNIQEYVSLVDKEKQASEKRGNHTDFLFRGQRRDQPLVPKLSRLKLRGKIENIEKLIIDEFRRTSLPLSEFKPEDDWDLLALAQHHGLPTRLLDWTYSALVGLWFTVKDTPYEDKNGKKENGIVWILTPEVEDFRTDTEIYGPLSNKITKIFRPKIISRRISAQSGAFTVHKINLGGRVVTFEYHKEFAHKLIKVRVPAHCFSSIRHRLNILGVNSSTVFPDIDGLCSHLKWRFSFFDDELKIKIKLKSKIIVKSK